MKLVTLVFSSLSYLFFLAIFVYLVLFMGGDFLKTWVPLLDGIKTINHGPSYLVIPGIPPVVHNILILVVFGLQHSVMARPGFKDKLTKIFPSAMERSIYVLSTCLLLFWLYLAWQPMTGVVWQIDGMAATITTLIFLMGASLVLWSTFMINHWELFGLSQAWHNFRGTEAQPDSFQEGGMYKFTRHPLYLGILITFWAIPVMSTGHLLFSAIWTAYIFIGIGYEERDLVKFLGKEYRDYMARVPQLIPIGRRKSDS